MDGESSGSGFGIMDLVTEPSSVVNADNAGSMASGPVATAGCESEYAEMIPEKLGWCMGFARATLLCFSFQSVLFNYFFRCTHDFFENMETECRWRHLFTRLKNDSNLSWLTDDRKRCNTRSYHKGCEVSILLTDENIS